MYVVYYDQTMKGLKFKAIMNSIFIPRSNEAKWL